MRFIESPSVLKFIKHLYDSKLNKKILFGFGDVIIKSVLFDSC